MTQVQGSMEKYTVQIITMKRLCISVCYCSC